MRISVITSAYNNRATIAEALESVLGQTFSGLESIVIDGSSTDDTLEVLKNYKDMLGVFVSEPDSGIYEALNKGIRRASGDVIGFLHADDLYAGKDVIARVADLFHNSGADAVYGDLVYVDKHNPDSIIRFWKSDEYSFKKLSWGWMPPHPALFIKRKIYEKARMPNGEYFDTSFKIAADYDLMMRLLGRMKISMAYLPAVIVKMRAGGKSNKNLRNIVIKSVEDFRAMRRNQIGGFWTLAAKNFRKLPQFLKKTIT